ncbi:ParB/RepB/Spo0J family partition protein [Parasulfuritortus cantonensis]|uniref:ParB/RepB/Spo0J family partition protein n=1 Tax=Parasulfuritortus cantonensis TaxID=2528202 RepID=A0A4R1B8X0_9PROT|nr:ParB/RepB/Spo0J family partition protein [Parasulfuritortus cantonensis]TCJ12729.1 ParB/RepB/Spo0J family partition protein [Parasulfuritortus cantonensis]
MAKLKGLGRGLDALLAEGETPEGERLLTLPLTSLAPGRYQPRTRMDESALAELADSIRSQGLMQPILARSIAGGKYEIIAGERRWRASQLAGLKEVPVLVRDVPDEAALKMALIENIQREDLNPLEEALGLQRLISEFTMTHQSVAESVGRSRTAVTNLLRLLNLAKPVQTLMMDGQLDMGHGRALLALSNTRQVEAAGEIVKRDLSVRETERLVDRLLKPAAPKPEEKKDRDVIRLEESLSERLATKVSINANRKGSGRLTVEFASLDQLDEILKRIK